ncbi:hypothetical protein OG21DRAFT_1527921 [Imleria badia]|nr:hypothetical protein OG21DRAFT_1527921 [Imleria badia]
MNGGDTKNLSFYVVSTYQTKKQGKNYNASAVMAKAYGFHLEHSATGNYIQGLQDQQQLLLFWLAHAMNQQQELAAPMVLLYIMGWGDVMRSHCYSTIFWATFEHALLCCFPSLHGGEELHMEPSSQDNSHANEDEARTDDYTVPLLQSESGQLYANSQMTDYTCCGEPFASSDITSYFTDSYETWTTATTVLYDLKDVSETWREVFDQWLPTTSSSVQRMMDNIQYYYECQHSDTQQEDGSGSEDNAFTFVDKTTRILETENGNEQSELPGELSPALSREAVHGKAAIQIAQELGIFTNSPTCHSPTHTFPVTQSITQHDVDTLDN